MAKDKDYNKMIHTSRWLRLRRDILTAHPICQRCEEQGDITPSHEVHHISPVEEAVSLSEKERRMFNPCNLLALCHDCHVKIHTEMGRSGKEAHTKRIKEQLKEINKRFFE